MKCLNFKILTQLVSHKRIDPSSTSALQVDRVTTFENVHSNMAYDFFLFQNLAEMQEETIFPSAVIAQQAIQHPRAGVLSLPHAAILYYSSSCSGDPSP